MALLQVARSASIADAAKLAAMIASEEQRASAEDLKSRKPMEEEYIP